MRVLLINSPVSRMSPHARVAPPLGLAYLAGHLRDAGHVLEVVDFNISGYNPRRLDLVLNRLRPQVVGVSAFTETYPNALLIAQRVKEFDAAVPVIFGGPHPSIMPEAVLAEPAVDYVVIGEGEATTAELLQALAAPAPTSATADDPPAAPAPATPDLARITGLAWKRDGQVVINERRELLDPDTLGLPARDLLSLEFYEDAFNVLTARGGCPYRCPFCSASHIWSGRHRPRSPKAVVDELELLVRHHGAAHVFFVDDIFTLRRDWVLELLTEMERLRGAFTWACGTRVDRVDPELLQAMAAHGCVGIQFGIESGAQEVLDSVKGIDREAALDAVRWAVEAGMSVTSSFMVPFPQDTAETLRETFGLMETLKTMGSQLYLSYTTPYPGTAFYEQAEELGLRLLTTDWGEYDAKHLVIETEHLSAATIVEIVEREAARMGLAKTA